MVIAALYALYAVVGSLAVSLWAHRKASTRCPLIAHDAIRRYLLVSSAGIALGFLGVGITMPIIKFPNLVLWKDGHSLLSTVEVLVRSDQRFLAVVIVVFCVIAPAFNILYLMSQGMLSRTEREEGRAASYLRVLRWLGKWSMHDVLVAAIIIYFIKSKEFAEGIVLPGMVFLAGSVVFTAVAHVFLDDSVFTHAGRSHSSKLNQSVPVWTVQLLLIVLVLAATALFVLGVTVPVVHMTKVWVLKDEQSIASITWALYEKSDYFLSGVLFMFSIVVPFVKILLLVLLFVAETMSDGLRRRSIRVVEWFGRYSMTDVLVLALVVVYMNFTGYVAAYVLPGAYYFTACALLTMFAYGVVHLVHEKREVAFEVPVAV